MQLERKKSKVRCAIMQPTYNPWIGYFDLIDKVDVFVYLDNVQLVKRSWQVRNRIKTPRGELFLTIPIKRTKGRSELLIKDAVIDDSVNWRVKHIKSIELNYKRAPFFREVFPVLEELIMSNYRLLADFNINFIEIIKLKIGIHTNTIRSSELRLDHGKKDELLVNICKCVNANIYISPQGSAKYIEEKSPGGAFAKCGIDLFYHNYKHPVYNQIWGEFLPYMGIIDLLFNEGFERALSIIRSGRREDIYYTIFRECYVRQ